VLLAVISLVASGAHASDLTAENAQRGNDGSASVPWLLGDWGGARTQLKDWGIDFQFGYTGEFAYNAAGGTENRSAYTDQYAAGVTLYEILSGGVLPLDFTGGYRRGHLRSGVRPLQIPELGGRRLHTVDQVVARMLGKRPEARFASIADCKRELTAALANEVAAA